jgi:hypothetical protein
VLPPCAVQASLARSQIETPNLEWRRGTLSQLHYDQLTSRFSHFEYQHLLRHLLHSHIFDATLKSVFAGLVTDAECFYKRRYYLPGE